MKLKRIGATALAIVLLGGGGTTNATYAMELKGQSLIKVDYQAITPLWESISGISPSISAEGTTLYPEVFIEAKKSSGSISGTMYLEKYSSGRWISVTSWSLKGTGNAFLSKSYRGALSTKYRTKVVVTVDGEKAEATSGICEI
jgi:hypothetical protein